MELNGEMLFQLRQLLDKEAIRDVLVRYCRAMDRLDRELLLSCYHPEALDDHGWICDSSDAFYAWASAWHLQYQTLTHHSVFNTTFDFNSDTQAHCETHYFFQAANTAAPLITLHGGRYLDHFKKRDGEWRIANRICLTEWHGALNDYPVPPETQALLDISGRPSRDRQDPSYERPLTIKRPRSGH